MGTQPIDVTWNITVDKPHQITVHRIGGVFSDTLKLTTDGQQILSIPAGGMMHPCGKHRFNIDNKQIELRWIWSVSGDPAALVILDGSTLLGSFGSADSISMISSDNFKGPTEVSLFNIINFYTSFIILLLLLALFLYENHVVASLTVKAESLKAERMDITPPRTNTNSYAKAFFDGFTLGLFADQGMFTEAYKEEDRQIKYAQQADNYNARRNKLVEEFTSAYSFRMSVAIVGIVIFILFIIFAVRFTKQYRTMNNSLPK